jgi:hypothetical protein
VELPTQRRRRLGTPFELDALVEVLGVLADHDQVDVRMADRDAGKGTGGPHRGEEVEALAERHVHAAEPRADRRRDRAFDGDAAIADRVEGLVGQERALGLERAPAVRSTHSMSTPVASRTSRAAAATSGPMPSPGMSVTRCAIRRSLSVSGAGAILPPTPP